MKILIPTYVVPDHHHMRTSMMKNILNSLKQKTDVDVVWVLFQPDKFISNQTSDHIVDIHDFPDAVTLLSEQKPDCVIVTSTLDPIQLSFSVAAKHLKIPLISIYIMSHNYWGTTDNNPLAENIAILTRKFLSDQTSTDSIEDRKFFRRGKFILYKHGFLLNTKRKSGTNFLLSIVFVIKEVTSMIQGKSKNYNPISDYHLLPDSSWIQPLKQVGIEEQRLIVTGNPYWADLSLKSGEIKNKKPDNDKINILIVTDALLEHGYWSNESRDRFFKNLFSELKKHNNISFSLKIHPSSEDRKYYEMIIKETKTSTNIFQKERIMDLINEFDIAISYGSTTAHTELIAMGMKIILLDANVSMSPAPLVEEAIAIGIVEKCDDVEHLMSNLHTLLTKNTSFSAKLIEERNRLFLPNGNASENVANAILKVINK